MNRGEFIKRLGAAALIPFAPVNLNAHEYINSNIRLITADHPKNYRTIIHAYDLKLETTMDEYLPKIRTPLAPNTHRIRRVNPWHTEWYRDMYIDDLPDTYDKYELSVWRVGHWPLRSGQPIGTEEGSPAPNRPFRTLQRKVWYNTFSYGFPTEITIDLPGTQ